MALKIELLELALLLWSYRVELAFLATAGTLVGVWAHAGLHGTDKLSGSEYIQTRLNQGEDL